MKVGDYQNMQPAEEQAEDPPVWKTLLGDVAVRGADCPPPLLEANMAEIDRERLVAETRKMDRLIGASLRVQRLGSRIRDLAVRAFLTGEEDEKALVLRELAKEILGEDWKQDQADLSRQADLIQQLKADAGS